MPVGGEDGRAVTDDPAARDAAAVDRYLARCAEDALGADRAAILADRLTTLARHLAVLSTACREPLFGEATTTSADLHE
jgi:hypothetical protein